MVLPLATSAGLSTYGEESFVPGQPPRTKEVVEGTYLDAFPGVLQVVPAFLVFAVVLGVIRLVFRLLGGQRPWRGLSALSGPEQAELAA
jgi:hypothetical protein